MNKEKMIECFNSTPECPFKNNIKNLANKLSKEIKVKVYAGVEHSPMYVLDSEYHLFCSGKHIVVRKKDRDPWFPNYYTVSFKKVRKNCETIKDVKEYIKNYLTSTHYLKTGESSY